jgi:hypothetical protein
LQPVTPGIRTHSEFHYYLDNREALNVLFQHGRLKDIHPQMVEELRNNRERDYATAAIRGQHMQLGFLQHSLMISRLHFMLEMACIVSEGRVELEAWWQGSQLAGHKVEVPKVVASRQGNEFFWQEHDVQTERLPVEPDALFTLRFAERPEQPAHFFYEADRGTMNSTDMMKKLRGYYHFIKKEQKHKEAFGVHPIRAVLIETTDEDRGKKLMQLVNHRLVVGPTRRSALFWFTVSPLFTDPAEAQKGQAARYLIQPEVIFQSIWALPNRSLHALADAENLSTSLP